MDYTPKIREGCSVVSNYVMNQRMVGTNSKVRMEAVCKEDLIQKF